MLRTLGARLFAMGALGASLGASSASAITIVCCHNVCGFEDETTQTSHP
jgi:hypothetical protein